MKDRSYSRGPAQQDVRPQHGDFGGEPAAAHFDPLQIVRRSLRGRYGWTIILTLLGLFVGAVLGWHFEKPLYKSEGLVRLAYALPPVFTETDQNQPMAMFESYMRSQQLRMSSRSLVEKALQSLHPGQKVSPDLLTEAADKLTIEHLNGTEHLRPIYVDESPIQTGSMVNAIIAEFQKEYDQQDKALEDQRISVLVDRQKTLEARLQKIENDADKIVLNDSTQRHTIDQRQQLLTDQVGAAEQLLHQYQQQEAQLQDQLDQLKMGGYLDSHPRMVELKRSVERTHMLVERFQSECRRLRGLSGPSESTAVDSLTASPDDLVSAGDTMALEAKKLELERLQEEGATVRKELAETMTRIEALKLEASQSRLDIISPGDIPLQPFRDRRRVLAWMGATIGACLPTALLILMGFVRPRYRYSDETEVDMAGPAGLLGILPTLPNHLADPERAAGAAQCVHQMRVMLQVAAGGKPRQYLVTSACAGEGKTSLTLALGLSFAASGSRTLVIDGDLVGRALTRGFGTTNERGLYEAINTGDPTPSIRQTSTGLWFLPAGRANALHASKVSGQGIRRLLEMARKEFDVVLIDSGPILGSVEAATFAPEMDGVIVTVSRGQQPALVEKTAQHIRSIGARIEGYVFNRAKAKDFYRSAYASSMRPMSSREMMVRVLSAESDGLLRFGPLVESVVSSLPANDLDDDETLQAGPRPEADFD